MLKALRGTKDILPADVALWRKIESSARDIFALYDYKEIRTPVMEEASLFIRSIGTATDIVQKEMYVFSDRAERSIALRPEATASIVRAYLENSLGQEKAVTKLFYIGPMFRSERPQKGRQRQFHQLGVEAIGSDNPLLDVEVISLAVRIMRELGIKDFNLNINSLGCRKDKARIIEKYRKAIKSRLDSLCGECRERYKKNVLRIFDCKNPGCGKVVEGIESGGFLCDDCAAHFESVKKGLSSVGINFIIDPRIVRGLDYYTKTVFEITQKDLGAKDAICAGGRYNNLIEEMGGKDTPAVGFAFGMERMILSLEKENASEEPGMDVFLAVTGQGMLDKAFHMMIDLRGRGLSCDIDYNEKSLKAQMRMAEKLRAGSVVIFGEDEIKKGKISLRDMGKREQKEVDIRDAAREILAIKSGTTSERGNT
ncbi:MAG: histidine--tRNA ligase [Candidatus Omnitrophica bacterium]|nr:histidine--tRNA ligase [Candidatus Omnitrophota bacterium]MBU1933007.1 histidine--tRNA ligase [Candidatus Omnitrophota bacterium]